MFDIQITDFDYYDKQVFRDNQPRKKVQAYKIIFQQLIFLKMSFQLRQKVMCINDQFYHDQWRLRKGVIYTIGGFYKCPCGSLQVNLVEIPEFINMICRCSRNVFRMQSYYNWRFVPLEEFEIFEEESEDIIENNAQVDDEEPQKELTSILSLYY